MSMTDNQVLEELQESVWRLEAKTEILEWLLGQLYSHEEITDKLEAVHTHWLDLAEREKSPMIPNRNQLMADAAKRLYATLILSRNKLRS